MMNTRKDLSRAAPRAKYARHRAILRSIKMDPRLHLPLSRCRCRAVVNRRRSFATCRLAGASRRPFRITATPLHREALIDQLCVALVDVWTRVALPLRLACSTCLVVCYESTTPDPLRAATHHCSLGMTERAEHTKRAIHLPWRSLQH
jgi:hypothetical protein